MAHFVILTKLSPEALAAAESVAELNERVNRVVQKECPDVRWLANYAVSGPFDYLDIFEAPDNQTATKVAVIIRSLGHATTETWMATPWQQFVKLSEVSRLIKR